MAEILEKEVFFNITDISRLGHVTIDLDYPVVVPSNFTELPPEIFDVKYLCNSQDPVALAQNFTYNLTSFTPNQIEVDLFFTDPLHVSSDSQWLDEISVRLQKKFFANVLPEGRDLRWAYNNTATREEYLELREYIGHQFAGEQEAEVVAAAAAVVTAALVVTVVIPMGLQILLKAAMSKVWSIFNTLQLIILMPLMGLSLPGNVQSVFDEINKIVNLDFIPKDKIYEFFFGEPLPSSDIDIKDYMLTKAGFTKNDLSKNIFLLVISLVLLVLLIGLFVLLGRKCFHRLPDKAKKVFISLKHKLMFNSLFRSLLQSYLPLSVSCMVSLVFAPTTFGYILLAFLLLCPPAAIWILRRQQHPLGHPRLKATIGSLYLNVDTVGKPGALMFTPLFMLRRLIFALAAVVIKNPLIQIFTTIYASLALILFYVVVWPMNDTVNNLLQLGNEVFFLVSFHFALVFTDYTTDPVQRSQVGIVFLVFSAINVFVNVALIAFKLYRSLKEYY